MQGKEYNKKISFEGLVGLTLFIRKETRGNITYIIGYSEENDDTYILDSYNHMLDSLTKKG